MTDKYYSNYFSQEKTNNVPKSEFAMHSLRMVFNTIYYQYLYNYANNVMPCQK